MIMAPIGDLLDRLAVNAADTPDKPALIDDRSPLPDLRQPFTAAGQGQG